MGVRSNHSHSRSKLAAISARVLIEFEPRRESAKHLEMELIESHMKIAYSIPVHQEFLRLGTPSEPILAEAAAQYMSRLSDIPPVLADYSSNGLVEKGESGELAARLLLITAYDNAVKNKQLRSKLFSDPVSLFSFLRELFGEDNCQILFKSTCTRSAPATRSRVQTTVSSELPFEAMYKHAYVRFTHFARFDKANEINTRTIPAAFIRGMAVQCDKNHESIDIVVPIVMKNSGILSESDMSAIFI